MRTILELDDDAVARTLELLGADEAGLADPTVRATALTEVVNTALALLLERLSDPDGDPSEALDAAQTRAAELESGLRRAELELATARAKAEAAPAPGEAVTERDAEQVMLAVASMPRTMSAIVDMRGVPTRIWRPTTDDDWTPIERLPSQYHELEYHLFLAIDQMSGNKGLRTFLSTRLLPTNEQFAELVTSEPLEPVTVVVPIKGVPHRWTLDPARTVVIGAIKSNPEKLRR